MLQAATHSALNILSQWQWLLKSNEITSVKTDDAVLQDNIGINETGLCQFVAASEAIW